MAQSNNQQRSVTEKATEAKSLIDSVYSKMASVLRADEYAHFLDAVNCFHWYPFVNIFLIYFKFPEAKYIAGYDVWEKVALSTYNDPSRRVLKQTESKNPIKVIAPWTLVNKDTGDRKLIHVSVWAYDVHQMNDLPIPDSQFINPSMYSVENIANAISFVAPYRKSFASTEDKRITYNVKGYCNHQDKQFIIDSMLTPRALLYVLFHEYAEAEVFLAGFQDETLSRLVVESVYYVLLKHFQLSTEDLTFSYVCRYKDVPYRDLAKAFHLIQSISHSIIEKIEEHLEDITDLLPVGDMYPYQTSFDDLDLQGFDFL